MFFPVNRHGLLITNNLRPAKNWYRVRISTPNLSVLSGAEMPNQELRVDCLAGDELLEDSAKVRGMINRLQADPLDRVQNAGPKVLLRACMARYDHFGQHANYVETLRQAILLDGKDA